MNHKLPREFYCADAVTLARMLIGKRLVHRTEEGIASGIIVETEAYPGGQDAASHAYLNRKTRRTAVHFGPGGFAYVFLIYGMHCCFNIVAGGEGEPQVVLIRALEPDSGQSLMAMRRKSDDARNWCSGPGKLCAALGISLQQYAEDLTGERLYLEETDRVYDIAVTERINVEYAGESARQLWRFAARGCPHVSRRVE